MLPNRTALARKTTEKTTLQSFADAHSKYANLIMRVPDTALLPINVDVPSVVTLICGAWPQIIALRPEIATLPYIDMTTFDSILELALALGHSQSLYLALNGPAAVLPPLAAEAQKTRDLFLDEVRLLGKRGLIDAAFVESFHDGPSYRAITFELLTLVNCLRALPEAAAARMRVTAAELDAAEALARSITQELGVRDQAPVIAAAAAHERQQTFTLVATAYDQARRAITFLRWNEGDADDIAPSLYAGRSGRRTTAQDEAQAPVPALEPVMPEVPATPEPHIAPGMPGSSPFLDEQ